MPADVLYLSAEGDDADALVPRFQAAGADLTRVHLWTDVALPTLPDVIEKIAYVVMRFGVRLIVFDPAGAFLSEGLNSNSDADVRRAVAPLRGLCEQRECAAVLLRHLNKDRMTTNPLYRGGGSIAWVAAARSALLAAEEPDDPDQFVLACTKASGSRRASSLTDRLEVVESRVGPQVRIEWLGDRPSYVALQCRRSESEPRFRLPTDGSGSGGGPWRERR